MGLKVTTDLSVLKNKTLVNFSFNKGNEYVLYVADKEGEVERVRIPAYVKNAMETYKAMDNQ